MMLRVVRGDAVRRDDYVVISLIGVDGRRSDTSVCVDACQNQGDRTQGVERSVQVRAEESAVTLLDDYLVRGVAFEFGQQFASVRAGDRDKAVLPPGSEECVAQVWGEFLANPNDRLLGLAEGGGEAVHGCHQLIPL